jgi:hypothetical protein
LSSNISVNSKLFAKTLKGVKQWPRGRCLTKKTRGQKSRETVSLSGMAELADKITADASTKMVILKWSLFAYRVLHFLLVRLVWRVLQEKEEGGVEKADYAWTNT